MNMQTAARSSLILTDISSLKRFADSTTAISYGRFYQLIRSSLIRGARDEHCFQRLGDRLIDLAEQAHSFRRMDMLEGISEMLTGLRLPGEYGDIGRYYQALCIHKFGLGNVEQALRLLEPLADHAPLKYRAKAMLSMGSMYIRMGDNQLARSLFLEALRAAADNRFFDPLTAVTTHRTIAVLQSMQGDHRRALDDLERISSLVRSVAHWHPQLRDDYLNSLAVELCEVGRLEEAWNVSQTVLASPFAPAYPEWSETNDEIARRSRRASRSVVTLNQWASQGENQITEAGNLVQLVAPQRPDSAGTRDSVATPAKQRASVVNLLEWKNEVTKRKSISKDRQTRLKELKKLPTEEKIAEIWIISLRRIKARSHSR
jgi:tetratricopeptide (TPR) repeat protein